MGTSCQNASFQVFHTLKKLYPTYFFVMKIAGWAENRKLFAEFALS
jgi:hypothetical protein